MKALSHLNSSNCCNWSLISHQVDPCIDWPVGVLVNSTPSNLD